MTRRQWLTTAAGTPLLAQTKKPNLVLIVSDDHHWQAWGAAGNPHIQTPNLDKLASRGCLFRQGIISTPQCAPSRGILLSGLESYQNGLDSNGHTSFRSFSHPTVVEQLRRAGYQTNLVGKWHIDNSPKDCGFTAAPLWLKPASSTYIDPSLRRGLDGPDQTVPGHITDLFSEAAANVVHQARDPYLLWLTYNAPHTPWHAGAKYRKLYEGRNAQLKPPAHPRTPPGVTVEANPTGKKKMAGSQKGRDGGPFDWETYYSVITHLDEGIGRVVNAIEKAGQWDNTLIAFIGDNGYLCGAKGLQGKVYAWEPSIRIPYMLSGGLIKKASVSDAPAASVDIPATLLDYAGLKPPYKLAGESLRSAANGSRFRRQASFASWNDGRPEGLAIMRSVEPYRLIRGATHKYILWESKKEALYDFATDPAEEKNLAADTASAPILAKLKDGLRARMKATADPAMAWMS